jgi:LysM repeat protein
VPAAAADWRRYAAPAAFLLAVTIAVVLVRSGLRQDASTPTASAPTAVSTATRPTKPFWTVRAGDTFGTISQKTGVPVATIERLNPKASSTSLFIGEKSRLR